MAATLQISEFTLRLAFALSETIDIAAAKYAGSIEFAKTLESGTAVDKADLIWSDTGSIAGGANVDIDLRALATTIFGNTVTQVLAKLKGFILVNKSTTAGDILKLDSSVTNGCTAPFDGSAASKYVIGADSPGILCAKKDGFTVDATHKVIRITNPGASAIAYDVVAFGTSA